jgi:hypothetical protein
MSKYVFIVMNDNNGDLRDQIEFICEDMESADEICFYLNLQVDYEKYNIIQWEVQKKIIDNN